jgi:hypothetical protein
MSLPVSAMIVRAGPDAGDGLQQRQLLGPGAPSRSPGPLRKIALDHRPGQVSDSCSANIQAVEMCEKAGALLNEQRV